MPREREFRFTEKDFEWIRSKVTRETGIKLEASKDQMVYSRLARRLRALGLPDFDSYRKVLDNDDGEEMGEFVNALTTNLTAFFREPHHFDHLMEVLQGLQERSIRIWSGGCSSGEEPYSIAMTALEALGEEARDRVIITATDLDSSVVRRGERGVYDMDRLSGVSDRYRKRYFLKGTGKNTGKVRVKPAVREMVHFSTLNLLHEWPFQERFHIVFCRNTVIYFNKDVQTELFKRMYRQTLPGAWLYIGHSESLWKVTKQFVSHGRTVYQRVD